MSLRHCRFLSLASIVGIVATTLVVGSEATSASTLPIAEYAIPTAGSSPREIADGSDGNLWFAEWRSQKIGRISTTGLVTEFPISTPYGNPLTIAAGPDGNIWFGEPHVARLGRITPSGSITEFVLSGDPFGITSGPDANLWFIETSTDGTGPDKIARMTIGGAIAEFAIPTAASLPTDIVSGPDGNLWFTEEAGNKIGRITTGGVITEFAVPTANADPGGIAPGADGNVWFGEFAGNKIGRITPAGVVSEFPVPTVGSGVDFLAAGGDGNVWFTERSANQLGRITPQGTITEFTIPTANSAPFGITSGSDGNIWFTEEAGNQIGRISPGSSIDTCALSGRPSVGAGSGSAIHGLYRLGDSPTTIAPNAGPPVGPGPFAALEGVYANILNCSPYVDPNSDPGTSAWVMLQQFGSAHSHMQLGWIKEASGSMKTLIELQDSVTEARSTIDQIIGTGPKFSYERCDNAASLAFLSCAGVNGLPGVLPVPTLGTSTRYTVLFEPTTPIQQNFVLTFTLSGTLTAVMQTLVALNTSSVLRQDRTHCTSSITVNTPLSVSDAVACSTQYTLEGTFQMIVQNPPGGSLLVASAPARFIPNQANVAGEIHSPYSQMPGTLAAPETFDDVHVFNNGAWVGFDGQETYNGKLFDDPGPWTLVASPAGSPGIAGQQTTGERIVLWDQRST